MKKFSLFAGILIFAFLFAQSFKQYELFRWKMRTYVINCSIFDFQMKLLKNVPGTMCVFLKNGDIVRYFDKELTGKSGKEEINLISKNSQIKWTRHYVAHHAMKADRNETRVYFLSFDKKKYQGHFTKFDRIIALDLKSGEELGGWSYYSLLKDLQSETGRPLKLDKCFPFPGDNEITHEVSHFNSINLVPESYSNDMEIIVNSGRGSQLFFTKDLNYLGKFVFNNKEMADSHDAQVTEDGNLLLYRNFGEEHPNSFLEIRSLKDNRILWSYTGDQKPFVSELFGSVQFFSDRSFLYSDMKNGGHFTTVNADGKVINDFIYPEIDPRTHLPSRFHTVRRLEYEKLSDDVQQLIKREIDKSLLGKIFLLIRA